MLRIRPSWNDCQSIDNIIHVFEGKMDIIQVAKKPISKTDPWSHLI